MPIDLKTEQEAALARPRLEYCLLARMLFWSMDVLYGRKTTFHKIRFLELLARIPYQAWEIRQYWRLNRIFHREKGRGEAEEVLRWGRAAQDNEYWHMVAVQQKIEEDGLTDNWFRHRLVPWVGGLKYGVAARLLALVSIRTAWRFNAEFEDHAEHAYMEFVRDNPRLEDEEVGDGPARDGRGPDGGRYRSWADVFRRMSLDEREHRNESFRRLGLTGQMVPVPDEE